MFSRSLCKYSRLVDCHPLFSISKSSSSLFGLRSLVSQLSSAHKFSMDSSLLIVLAILLARYFWTTALVCFGSLSCWNIKFWGHNGWADGQDGKLEFSSTLRPSLFLWLDVNHQHHSRKNSPVHLINFWCLIVPCIERLAVFSSLVRHTNCDELFSNVNGDSSLQITRFQCSKSQFACLFANVRRFLRFLSLTNGFLDFFLRWMPFSRRRLGIVLDETLTPVLSL